MPQFWQALNPLQGFVLKVTPTTQQANFGEETCCIPYHILGCYNQELSWEGAYMRLTYSGDQKTEQLQFRVPGNTLPQWLGRRQPWEAVTERRVRCKSAEKFKHWRAQAAESIMISGYTLCGKKQDPPPVDSHGIWKVVGSESTELKANKQIVQFIWLPAHCLWFK
jgi:hypothetical protein